MATVEFTLPDALAQRARSEGLLSDAAMQQLLAAAAAEIKAARAERRAREAGPQGTR